MIVLGIILLLVQLMSDIGSIYSGRYFSLSFDSVPLFVADLIVLISSHVIGILGLTFLFIGVKIHKAKTKVNTEDNKPVYNEENQASVISDKYGTKWFTFYTKIRPALLGLGFITVISDFLRYVDIYTDHWWMLLNFGISVVNLILSVAVAFKSDGDYRDFVRFVRGVLLFETIGLTYQLSVEQYIINNFDFNSAILGTVISLPVFYFLWYCLNIRYFIKRIRSKETGDEAEKNPITLTSGGPNTETTPEKQYIGKFQKKDTVVITNVSKSKKQRFCKHCGGAIDNESKKCSKCGKQYFRLRINWGSTFAVTITVLAIAIAAVSLYRTFEYQNEITLLKDQQALLQNQIDELTSNVYDKNVKITKLEKQIEDKNLKYTKLLKEKQNLQTKVDFYDDCVVFVLDDGTNRYHKFDCFVFTYSNSEYWAYNIEYARYRGYKACFACE